jgi:hypothetical protein
MVESIGTNNLSFGRKAGVVLSLVFAVAFVVRSFVGADLVHSYCAAACVQRASVREWCGTLPRRICTNAPRRAPTSHIPHPTQLPPIVTVLFIFLGSTAHCTLNLPVLYSTLYTVQCTVAVSRFSLR